MESNEIDLGWEGYVNFQRLAGDGARIRFGRFGSSLPLYSSLLDLLVPGWALGPWSWVVVYANVAALWPSQLTPTSSSSATRTPPRPLASPSTLTAPILHLGNVGLIRRGGEYMVAEL